MAKKSSQKSNNATKKNSGTKVFLILIALAVTACVAVGVLVYADIISIGPINDLMISIGLKKEVPSTEPTTDITPTEDYEAPTMGSSYEVPIPDSLEEYYASISTVFSSFDAATSESNLTEEEIFAELTQRGFTQQPITTNYTIDGDFCYNTEISDSSSQKHPSYQTYYLSSSGVIWTINVINGNITALPASYNSENFNNTPLILSETKMTTSYDSSTNTFYIIVPFSNVLNVKQVDYIDAQLLETLTIEEIEKL